jgi:hypothetical protein
MQARQPYEKNAFTVRQVGRIKGKRECNANPTKVSSGSFVLLSLFVIDTS